MDLPTVNPRVADVLAAPRRRRVLAALRERDGSASVDRLAAALTDTGSPAGCDARVECADPRRIALEHAVLPALAEAGAVDYDRADGSVTARSDSAFDRAWVKRLLADGPDPAADALLDALSRVRRQLLLYALVDAGEPLLLSAAAAAIAAHESGYDPDDVPDARLALTRQSLQHAHVPVLAAAGLVEFDHERRLVALTDAEWHTVPWVAASPLDDWPWA